MNAPRRRALALDIETFISTRQQRWRDLEQMLDRFNDGPDGRIGRARVLELVRLYRLACSDLNQARTYTANPELLGRLNQLVGRAYRVVYQEPPGRRVAGAIRRFLFEDAPLTFRREARWVLAAAGMLLLGAIVGFAAVLSDPANGEAIIPGDFFTESPADRVEHIEQEGERIDSVGKAAAFGSQLYTHNIQVSFMTFAAGALSIVGAWALLFFNGMLLGAVAGMYLLDGVGTFFIAWVGPHGALELPAIVFAAAAGLKLGDAFLIPGDRGRPEALRAAAPAVCRMLVTAALVLVCAGLIEGSFSQFSSKTVPYAIKIVVAAALFIALCFWLFIERRRKDA
ncbi:MAG: stage II sporulation protein M [Planctomycetes bacterium]|nr:stage II sporulation protein M [Planctomycetota bacterium]